MPYLIAGDQINKLSQREMNKQMKKCWNPSCKKRGWIRDWCNWNWCLKCFAKRYIFGYEEHKWTKIKLSKIKF